MPDHETLWKKIKGRIGTQNNTSYSFIDSQQHGFLNLKSCSSNMIIFTDNVVLSINDTHSLSIDIVYFDFSKAFDSVNHDLIN